CGRRTAPLPRADTRSSAGTAPGPTSRNLAPRRGRSHPDPCGPAGPRRRPAAPAARDTAPRNTAPLRTPPPGPDRSPAGTHSRGRQRSTGAIIAPHLRVDAPGLAEVERLAAGPIRA